jgi:hypothetical protein
MILISINLARAVGTVRGLTINVNERDKEATVVREG